VTRLADWVRRILGRTVDKQHEQPDVAPKPPAAPARRRSSDGGAASWDPAGPVDPLAPATTSPVTPPVRRNDTDKQTAPRIHTPSGEAGQAELRAPRTEPPSERAAPVAGPAVPPLPTAAPTSRGVRAAHTSALPLVPPASSKPVGFRRLHLGVDFGTCWSKLVLRDYEANTPRAFVVRPPGDVGGNGDYRIPSSVVLQDDRLYFGWSGRMRARCPGAVVFHSPKIRAAFGSLPGLPAPPAPDGIDDEGLATLAVAYLLGIGGRAARHYANSIRPPANPKLSMTMGVPMRHLDDGPVADRFLKIARLANDIVRSDGPMVRDAMPVGEALSVLEIACDRMRDRAPVTNVREWIRSEAEAGLLWVFQSPAVPEGIYGCVDVGAGTTDVSFFRITPRFDEGVWQKEGLAFYSAESRPPGVDAFDAMLMHQTGVDDLYTVRGNEGRLVAAHDLASDPGLRGVCEGMFEVYRDAWRRAFPFERAETRWTNYGLFVLGGGAKIAHVIDALRQSVWQGRLGPRIVLDPGFPTDLYDWPDGQPSRLVPFVEDPAFALVAYGLSFLGLDVPPVERPGETPPLVVPGYAAQLVDQEEYYPR
jgi:hypothetical protein